MTRLEFHRELYDGTAVDEAVRLYSPYGAFELKQEPSRLVVEVTCPTPKKERKVSLELANYALGLTIRERKKQS
jgi:hypothetical protein